MANCLAPLPRFIELIRNSLLYENTWRNFRMLAFRDTGTLVVEEDSLDFDGLEIIQRALENNPKLSFAWGFQPVQKSRAPDAIRRVAMWGDPKDREINTKVIRSSRMRVS